MMNPEPPPEFADLRAKDVFVPDRLMAADRALEPDPGARIKQAIFI